ncbi:MAG: DUF58 domain-containing protein [Elusimicrobiota bacterium]
MRLDRWRYRGLRCVYVFVFWVRRRFTQAGRLALTGLVLSAALGLDTDQNVAYQAFTFLLALLALAMLLSLFFREKFRITRNLPRFGTAGKALPYEVTIGNPGDSAQRGLSFMEAAAQALPSFEEFYRTPQPPKEEGTPLGRLTGYDRWRRLLGRTRIVLDPQRTLPDVPPRGEAVISLELMPRRRGRLALAGAMIARPDPLGLCKGLFRTSDEQSVLILPKRYSVPDVALSGRRRYQSGGVSLSSSVGDSQEFMSLRDYRAGDPLRRVYWKGLAKTGKLITKEYQDEYFVRHALALDTFTGGGRGAVFEEAVSVAASFACSVLTQESLLDLLFVGNESYCVTAGRGLGGADKLLEVLACVEKCEDKPFQELDHGVAKRHASLSGCICVLLDFDEPRRVFIRRLRSLDIPVLAVVVSAPGAPPIEEAGVYRLEVGKIAEGLAGIHA